MNEAERCAFLISQAICALIEAMGKHAENMARQHRGEAMAYTEADFVALINAYAIGHNSALSALRP